LFQTDIKTAWHEAHSGSLLKSFTHTHTHTHTAVENSWLSNCYSSRTFFLFDSPYESTVLGTSVNEKNNNLFLSDLQSTKETYCKTNVEIKKIKKTLASIFFSRQSSEHVSDFREPVT